MILPDPEAFAAFGELAARTIEIRNAEYGVVAGRKFACDESRNNALRRIAGRQTAELHKLGEAGDAYEQVARDLLDTERQIAQAEVALEDVVNIRDERRLCVWALAGSLCEAMPELANAVEHGVQDRIALIEQEDRVTIRERIAGLQRTLGDLSLLFEAAGQPWPVATAQWNLERSDQEPGNLNGNGAHPSDTAEEFGAGTIEMMPAPLDYRNGTGAASNGDQRAERIIYEQRLSEEIALYLVEHAGEIVSPDEIAAAVYSPEAIEEIKRRGYEPRNLITSPLGPESGTYPRTLIEALGYSLQYGWRYKTRIDGNGVEKKFGPRYRVYRAVEQSPDDTANGSLEEFVEVVYRSEQFAELAAA